MIIVFIGTTELLLIGGLALLLVGGKKLPEMMRGLGKGVREFKDGMNEASTPDPNAADAQDESHDKSMGEKAADNSNETHR